MVTDIYVDVLYILLDAVHPSYGRLRVLRSQEGLERQLLRHRFGWRSNFRWAVWMIREIVYALCFCA